MEENTAEAVFALIVVVYCGPIAWPSSCWPGQELGGCLGIQWQW